MKKAVLILSFLTVFLSAKSLSNFEIEDVILGFGSYHFDRKSKYNEINPTIGLKFKNGLDLLFVTKNSIGKKSIQIAYNSDFYRYKKLKLGYRIGVATGYKNNIWYHHHTMIYTASKYFRSGIIPFLALETTYEISRGVDAVVDLNTDAVMLGFKIKI